MEKGDLKMVPVKNQKGQQQEFIILISALQHQLKSLRPFSFFKLSAYI